jgi:LacI family transcriptional regulator
VLDTLMNLEDRRITHEATLDLLKKHADLAGICVAGGGMEGVIDALREEDRAGSLSVVVNELTPESRSALVDEIVTLVIATPVRLLAERTVEAMCQRIGRDGPEVGGELFLPFDLYTSENI